MVQFLGSTPLQRLLPVSLALLLSTTLALAHDKKTSKGNNIDHEHRPAFTDQEKRAADANKQKMEREFGNKIRQVPRDGPTRAYNCAGLVFCTSTSWVTKLGTLEALCDEGYRRLKDGEKAKVGDVVVYYKNDQFHHVGVVEEVDDRGNVKKVRSKWGEGGEFVHDPDAVPSEYGTPTVFTK